MTWGPVPPSGGPYRDGYLDANGRRALADADEHYAIALDLLRDLASLMPIVHSPLTEPDRQLRIAIQKEKAKEWASFNATVPDEIIATVTPHLLRSETSAVAALNFLEDHELAHAAHAAIHRAAFARSGFGGCAVYAKAGEVWTRCSMRIHHIRVGASVGIESDFECSICGLPVEDCDEHISGQQYAKVAATTESGECNICDASRCDHVVGESYETMAFGNARNIKMGEASIVDRPQYPMARIHELELDLGDLSVQPELLAKIERGEIHCQECLAPCEGFMDFRQWSDRESAT
ncbi:hypothetical protein ACFC1I_03345 [Microbacterium sp. NPDC056044]|uniref:hypothetical protein n=1 Tax=Microbacterium sp. NPDC056044 TaxID=3345690 RepID=UPI0035D7C018